MRYFCYNELGNDEVVVVTEEDIRSIYYPYWSEQMIKKFGSDKFQDNYCFQDCIQDWMIVNWAWEVDDDV